MDKHKVSIARYEEPSSSVRKAVALCDGLSGLSPRAKVFVKPNIVFWARNVPFPKYGVVSTSRVVHDMILILKDLGIDDITIGEGTVVYNPKDHETAGHAFHSLGYDNLKKRYGVNYINVFQRPFDKVDLGDGVHLNFNRDFLESDFLVNIPVMKTHAQTIVSLGVKNVKGLIDVNSRKKCHSPDPEKDLHYMVSKLAKVIPSSFTIIDGIYTNERGPGFDGKMRRSNLLVASNDVFSADKVASTILGHQPADVPHLSHVGAAMDRPMDLSDVEITGERIQDVTMKLDNDFPYNQSGTLPLPMEKMGISGLAYHKYDLTMCTYCSALTGVMLSAIASVWKGEPWDDVEILTGKIMRPDPRRKHSILVGRCLFEANKNHPSKDDLIFIKTCPPATDEIVKALHKVGIEVNPAVFQKPGLSPCLLYEALCRETRV